MGLASQLMSTLASPACEHACFAGLSASQQSGLLLPRVKRGWIGTERKCKLKC
jgi:hypothetical protein